MSGDPQASRVYAAEYSIDQGAQLYAPDQVRRYVASITSSDWWQEHGWPAVKVHIGRGDTAWGGRLASGSWYVNLPGFRSPDLEADARRAVLAGRPVDWPWAWQEQMIAHELAHVAQFADLAGRARPAGHGSGFCGYYLEATEAIRGPLGAWRLRRAFERHAVAFAEPPTLDVEPCGPDALRAAAWIRYSATRGALEPGYPARQLAFSA